MILATALISIRFQQDRPVEDQVEQSQLVSSAISESERPSNRLLFAVRELMRHLKLGAALTVIIGVSVSCCGYVSGGVMAGISGMSI